MPAADFDCPGCVARRPHRRVASHGARRCSEREECADNPEKIRYFYYLSQKEEEIFTLRKISDRLYNSEYIQDFYVITPSRAFGEMGT